MKNLLLSLLGILFSCSIMAQKAHDVFTQKHHIVDSHFKTEKHHSREMAHFDDLDISLPVMSNNENVIQVDSVFITNEYGFHRDNYYFDVNGNVVTRLRQELEDGIWINISQQIYTYDSNGNRLVWLSQNWDVNNWVNSYITTYTYDANGKTLSYLEQDWENSTWVNYWFISNTFDANGNLLNELVQEWGNGIWVNVFLFTETYNGNGANLTTLSQRWENGIWVNNRLYTYTNDVNGNIGTELLQFWLNDTWEDQLLFTYTYDDNDKRLTDLTQGWENGSWVDYWLFTYTYDNLGNNLTYLNQVWEENEIANSFLWSYVYDDNGNRLEGVYKLWIDNEWMNEVMVGYEFLSGQVNAIAYEWEDNNWIESQQSKLLPIYLEGEYIFMYSGLNLQLYSTEIIGIKEQDGNMDNSLIKFSPNPVSNQINIEIDPSWKSKDYLIELYNQNGQKLKMLEVSQNDASLPQVFNVEDIPTGLYVLKVDNGKQVFTKKIIVSR